MILNNKRRINSVSDGEDIQVIKVSKRLRLQKRYELEFELSACNARDIFVNEREASDISVQQSFDVKLPSE